MAGATGYTGRAVVSALRARGVEVIAHVRPDSPSLDRWRDRFGSIGARVDVTPWEADAMHRSMTALQPSLVFGLLGTTRARARRARRQHGRVENYATVDVGLTMMLYDAARRSGARPRFVYLSAVGVGQDTRNEYVAARALVERRLEDGDLPSIIARPSFISGPDRDEFRLAERLGVHATDLLLWLAGLLGAHRLRERYRSTTSAILADALVGLALDPHSENRVYQSEELRGGRE